MAGTFITRAFTLNLGLNNNPRTADDSLKMLEDWRGITIKEAYTAIGLYNDVEEPTLVVKGTYGFITGEDDTFDTLMEKLCVVFEQEAIAYKYGIYATDGKLSFHPRYKGERFDFNEELYLS